MSKVRPNIVTPFNDRQRFKNLVQEIISDTTIFSHVPDSISLDITQTLFTLVLLNKKFVFEELKVDDLSDYVDIYLQGVKKSDNAYSVTDNGNDIIINFSQNITLAPEEILNTDFLIKGKIVSR